MILTSNYAINIDQGTTVRGDSGPFLFANVTY